jgi:hypothetical protein
MGHSAREAPERMNEALAREPMLVARELAAAPNEPAQCCAAEVQRVHASAGAVGDSERGARPALCWRVVEGLAPVA